MTKKYDGRIVRTLPLDVHANASKHHRLADIHRRGILCVRDDLRALQKDIQKTGQIPRFLNPTDLPDHGLSARYRAELAPNALGPVRAWHSNVINRAKGHLKSSSIMDTRGKVFYRAVYRLIAFKHGIGEPRPIEDKLRSVKIGKKEAPLTSEEWQEAYLLCRCMTRHAMRSIRYPTIRRNASLTVGGKVVQLNQKTSTSFDTVVSFSGLRRGERISFPANLPLHTRYRLYEGFELSDTIQFAPRGGVMRIRVVASKEVIERHMSGKIIGIDVGAVHPVVTSEGDVFGRDFWARVQHYDHIMQRSMKGVQPRHDGRKHWRDSRAYRNTVRKIRGYVGNEIRRAMNRLVDIHNPDELVIENLTHCFGGSSNLSKKMKRLLASVGRAAFRNKVAALSEERLIKVIEVNPSYTSKGCHCGNVDDKNRPRREMFRCTRCGRTRHADVHAATMILSRRSAPDLSREVGESLPIGGRRAALRYQNEITHSWCAERGIQPEESAGAGREMKSSAALKNRDGTKVPS